MADLVSMKGFVVGDFPRWRVMGNDWVIFRGKTHCMVEIFDILYVGLE